MYTVVGKYNCSRCQMVKNILDEKKINYEYKLLEELTDIEKEKYMTIARLNKQMSLPIILNGDIFVKLQEVMQDVF